MKKVAFITSILGGYEATCKPFVKQTIDTDFICFTDNSAIKSNGWIIDTHPYFKTHPSDVDKGYYLNSIKKIPPLDGSKWAVKNYGNVHSFNLAKYYKQSWRHIPRLEEYDVIIWIDGSIEIISETVAEYMLELCPKYGVVTWNHEMRAGCLLWEVEASFLPRYHYEGYLDQQQPYQDVLGQYHNYLEEGYEEQYLQKNFDRPEGRGLSPHHHFGVWATGFVAFDNRSEEVKKFTDIWYLQTLKYTTQDQVGFVKAVWDTKLVPYTLPDEKMKGVEPHLITDAFKVHRHGL